MRITPHQGITPQASEESPADSVSSKNALAEIKQQVDSLCKDWEDFKAANDNGATSDVLERINKSIDAKDDQIKKLIERQNGIEVRLNRTGHAPRQ